MAEARIGTVALQIGLFDTDVPGRLRAFGFDIALWGEADSRDAEALAHVEADGYLPQVEGPSQFEAALNNLRTGVGAGLSRSVVITPWSFDTFIRRPDGTADGASTTVEVESLVEAGCTHAFVECYTGDMRPSPVLAEMWEAHNRGFHHANPVIGLARPGDVTVASLPAGARPLWPADGRLPGRADGGGGLAGDRGAVSFHDLDAETRAVAASVLTTKQLDVFRLWCNGLGTARIAMMVGHLGAGCAANALPRSAADSDRDREDAMSQILRRFNAAMERIDDERKLGRIILEAATAETPETVARATLPGDNRRLRGFPRSSRGGRCDARVHIRTRVRYFRVWITDRSATGSVGRGARSATSYRSRGRFSYDQIRTCENPEARGSQHTGGSDDHVP